MFRWALALVMLAGAASFVPVVGFADEASGDDAYAMGESLFREQCAHCHGEKGEGVEGAYADPLVGDRSIDELARIIEETMPEEDPEACTGEDARQVAAYVHETFYSPAAQARNRPPRVELSRLTVQQYKNSIADLVASFRGEPRWGESRGLEGEYFDAKNFRRNKREIERVDPQVDFEFGASSPDPEKIGEEEFSARWRGAVLAPETGHYEFTVETENGARLWVNDNDRALIDAWVRSGDETRHTGTVFLLAGRPYPLRLEFFKSKEESASVRLEWKVPHHEREVVPERCLSPDSVPPSLLVETAFPPDDRSVGYERGTAISAEWDEATTYAALDVAAKLVEDLPAIAGVKDDASDRAERLRAFCAEFVERAFRHPLSDEQRRFFVDQHFEDADDVEASVKRVVLLALKSPRFLYPNVGTEGQPGYERASRLALALWDSLPDDELREAAARGSLETPEQIREQAQRMLGDLRARAKMRGFLHRWLLVEEFEDIAKDSDQFEGFDASLVSDLRTSLDLFLEAAVWDEEGADFRRLIDSEHLYANGRLAQFYDIDLPEDAPFQRVAVDAERHAGVLSHPLLMSGFAYTDTSSPIHRGVFLARSVLGRTLRPPPEAVSPLSPDLHEDMTTRERVAMQTSPATCQTCHEMINALGFSLEHYDAVGRYRTEERDQPIDATGRYVSSRGEEFELDGIRSLAEFLTSSEEVRASVVRQLFEHVAKQPLPAYGADAAEQLQNTFAENDFDLQHLLVEIAVRATLGPDPAS